MPRIAAAAAALLAALAAASLAAPIVASAAPGTEDPARQPPFGGERPPTLERVPPGSQSPPDRRLDPRAALRIAAGAEAVRAERAESSGMEPVVYTRGSDRWQVSWFAEREGERVEVALAVVDDRSGRVVEAWRDHQVGTPLARGYEGAVAQKANAPYVWIPLCVLFVAPFFDPRRPFRLVHLDLLALLGFSASLFFFNRAEIVASVALTYPFIAYLLARLLWVGARGVRDRVAGGGPLVPYAPTRLLIVGAVALAVARIALNVADSQVIDVGYAGVIGADRIVAGQELYGPQFSEGLLISRADVYGPATYLAYVPFELALPWSGEWDGLPAAHAAAIAFDLLIVLGLAGLGRRLAGGGASGRRLGAALAFAWLAYPFSLYALNANTNDALVGATLVGAMLVLASPAGRGAMVALGTLAKVGPAAVAPLFAGGTGERRLRSAAVFALAFVAVGVALLVPFVPDGGLGELYDRTLGYQASRGSPFSVWGLAPSLDFLQPVVRAGAVALAIAVAFLPRRRTAVQVAALAAAVVIAVQLGAVHWFYFYLAWFAPLALVALLAPLAGASARPPAPPGSVEGSSLKPPASPAAAGS